MATAGTNGKRLLSVCGKGGAGKTAITAMMTRALMESGRAGALLVIDADPALGQVSALGVRAHDVNGGRTMGEIREEIIRTAKEGNRDAKADLAAKLDYMVFEALTELDGFAFLAMGRTETLGCYCPVNSLLRRAIETLTHSFDTILIDGEAGLEQINRQVTRHLDTLLIVSDPSSRGLETAAMINDMVQRDKLIDCRRVGIIFNRVLDNVDLLNQSAERIGVDVLALVPHDPAVAAHDLRGRPIHDLPADSVAQTAVRRLVEETILA
jgi:CO dehydrogenase maturation factor